MCIYIHIYILKQRHMYLHIHAHTHTYTYIYIDTYICLCRLLQGLQEQLRKCEQAFELSDASAERSAAGCTIKLNEDSVKEYLKLVLIRNTAWFCFRFRMRCFVLRLTQSSVLNLQRRTVLNTIFSFWL